MTRQYMGHSPNRKAQKHKPAQTAMQQSHHRPVDHINKLMIIAKREIHTTKHTTNKRVS